MNVTQAIKQRRSTRAFLDKPVEKKQLENILELASHAPSGTNSQPWQVCVVTGHTKQQITDAFINAKESAQPENPDYDYYPQKWFEPYKTRRIQTGMALYSALKIERTEKEKQKQAWYNNYRFFNAPVGLVIYIHKDMGLGSLIDTGMFIQNIMLAAKDHGLDTCPQAAFADYPDILRDILNISPDYKIIGGISLGYADTHHPANNFSLTRESVENFTRWFE